MSESAKENADDKPMHGKVCVITGATSGVGLAAAEQLGRMGATLALVGRDRGRGEATLRHLRSVAPEATVRLYYADLSLLSEMRQLAEALKMAEPRIDVLINNAGSIFPKREITEDGLEKTFAVNHMAPFVVTYLLMERLTESAPARVITTSSKAHGSGRIDFEDLQMENGYGALKAYSASKLANILFTRELARRLQGTGVTANCFHPGFVASRFGKDQSRLIRTILTLARPFAISPAKGAETAVHLAAGREVADITGQYFEKCRVADPASQAQDDDAAQRLWEESLRLARLPEET